MKTYTRPALALSLTAALTLGLAAGCATSPESLTKDNMDFASQSVLIDAPIDKAWEQLSALDELHVHHPKVEKSFMLTEQKIGIGAQRRIVQDGGKIEMDSRVTDWQEGRSVTMESTRIEGIPMAKFLVTLALAETPEGTRLTTNYHYKMTGIATLMPVEDMMNEGLRTHLLSFKHAIETGENVADMATYEATIAPKYAAVSTDAG